MKISFAGEIDLSTDKFGITITGSVAPGPPTPPVAGYIDWQRADQATAGALATFPDQSGNSHDDIQAVSGRQPTIVANVLNGKKALRFSGSNDMGCVGLSVSQPNTIFFVAQMANTTGNQSLMDGLSGRQLILLVSGVLNVFAGSSVISTGAQLGTTPHVIAVEFNGGSTNVWVDGVLVASNINPGGGGLASEVLGTDISGTADFTGDIFERIIYPSILSTQDRKGTAAYLAGEYGLTLGQPQITLVDFNGLSGLNFVTAGAGKGFVIFADAGGGFPNLGFGIWFNTGTETQPDFSGSGAVNYIEVGISAAWTASQIANIFLSASGFSTYWDITTPGASTSVQFVTKSNLLFTNAVDVTSGTTIVTTQEGSGNS